MEERSTMAAALESRSTVALFFWLKCVEPEALLPLPVPLPLLSPSLPLISLVPAVLKKHKYDVYTVGEPNIR